MGGDEFVVLATSLAEADDIGLVGQRIVAALAEPFELELAAVRIGASVGAAIYPRHGTTRDGLVRAADGALYDAKHAGRGRYRLATAPA